jgi:hypothetical protein
MAGKMDMQYTQFRVARVDNYLIDVQAYQGAVGVTPVRTRGGYHYLLPRHQLQGILVIH